MLLAFLLIETQQYVTNQEQIIHKTFPDCAKLCLLVPLYVCYTVQISFMRQMFLNLLLGEFQL